PYAHPSPASLSPLSLHDALPIFPRLLVLLPLVPPLLLRRELLDPERLGLRVALVALGVWVLVEPDLLRRLALCEEEQVRLDAGVGAEDPLRQPDDRVKVGFLHQLLFDARLHSLPEEGSVRKDDACAPPGLQQGEEQHEEEVSRLPSLKSRREVLFDAILL